MGHSPQESQGWTPAKYHYGYTYVIGLHLIVPWKSSQRLHGESVVEQKSIPWGAKTTTKGSQFFCYLGVEPKIGGFYPQNGWFIRKNPMNKWMIWGYQPYFWKHPSRHLRRCHTWNQHISGQLIYESLTWTWSDFGGGYSLTFHHHLRWPTGGERLL